MGHEHNHECGCGGHEHNHEHEHNHDHGSCGCHDHDCGCGHEHNHGSNKIVIARIVIAVLMTIALEVLEAKGLLPENIWIVRAFYVVPYLIAGYDIIWGAFKSLLKKHVFDENFLMAIATIGCFALGEELRECVMVVVLFQIGELFEHYAVNKSRNSISELMDIRPDYANIKVDGEIKQVDPHEINVGDIIIVEPGEKVPIDGTVVSGMSTLDTAALTGESAPVDVEEGSDVISGTININGVLEIKTTKEFGESTVSKVLELVENADDKKANSENFITKFAKYYTPIVCGLALAVVLIPPVINIIMGADPGWRSWAYRALTFLVISCPCAMVISIPLSFFASIGGASRQGILVKGSNFMESLAKLKYIMFDKTGTMTKGVFEVNGVHHNSVDDDELIELAALAEIHSSHPISKCLIDESEKRGRVLDKERVKDVQELAGFGIEAKIDDKTILVGNDKLMKNKKIEFKSCHDDIGTVVHVAIDGAYAGHILICDMLKDTAEAAVKGLKKYGMKKTIILTGDAKNVADDVAKTLGVDEVYGELLPNEKVEKVEEILASKGKKETVGFVGDGINDAPVLARADVGIAMGALGSDAAIEAADVVLMDDEPLNILKAVKIAKKCMRIVYENIYFAVGIKVICMALSFFGEIPMWLAVFADVGVMVIAVINAMRGMMKMKV